MWWRRAFRLKTAPSLRAASTSARVGRRTRSRKKFRRVLRRRRRNRPLQQERRSALRRSLIAERIKGGTHVRERVSFGARFFCPLESEQRTTNSVLMVLCRSPSFRRPRLRRLVEGPPASSCEGLLVIPNATTRVRRQRLRPRLRSRARGRRDLRVGCH